MKHKKIILMLLIISIFINIIMFYNTIKYKNILEDDIEYRIGNVFLSADFLENELGKIRSDKITDKEQLNKIWSEYEKIMISLNQLNYTAHRLGHKEFCNLNSYGILQHDLDRFIQDIVKEYPSSKASLTDDDIKFIIKFRRIVNRMQDIHKKYSYTKDNCTYVKKDQWKKILQELGSIDMIQASP